MAFSHAYRVVQHVLIIPDDLQRHVQLARDAIRITLAQRFGARVLDRGDETQRGLPARPAFGLDAIRGSCASTSPCRPVRGVRPRLNRTFVRILVRFCSGRLTCQPLVSRGTHTVG